MDILPLEKFSIILYIVIAFILFIILSPGLLLNIPGLSGEYISWRSNKVTLESSIVHAGVFCLLLFGVSHLIKKF